jgi:nitrate/nitrite-specific signal transduction histidine kinase
MREQAGAIDARLDIWSAPAQGTRVTLTWRAPAPSPIRPAGV